MDKLKNTNLEEMKHLLKNEKEWYTPRDVGEILGVSDQFVRNAIKQAELFAYNESNDNNKRCHRRVHKQGLLMYLMKTANHTTTEFQNAVLAIIERFSIKQLQALKGKIDTIIKNKA